MIPGDLLSACRHRQFHTLPGLLDSWAALPNSYPNACMPMQGGSLYHFYDGLWYDPAEKRTHDLPCERRTRYRLSQPDTGWSSVETTLRVVQLAPVSLESSTNPFGHDSTNAHFLPPGLAYTTGFSHNPFTWLPLLGGKNDYAKK